MNRRNLVASLGASLAVPTLSGAALRGAAAVRAPGHPYAPDWASLERHVVPKWYQDAKLGIFIRYGLY
jgi:Alpha-L-fucosidase